MAGIDPTAEAFRRTARPAAAVADLDLDANAVYSEAQMQAIADKLDELLAALRTAELMDE